MATDGSVVEAFYEVYSETMRFLENNGFCREVEDAGLVQRLRYTKADTQFLFVLDVRDVVIDHFAVLLLRNVFQEPSGIPLLALLSETEKSDPELQELKAQVDRLYKDRKFYLRVWLERDINATRILLQKLASLTATVLRKYGDRIIERLHCQNGPAAIG